jgi:hypothetical protein
LLGSRHVAMLHEEALSSSDQTRARAKEPDKK